MPNQEKKQLVPFYRVVYQKPFRATQGEHQNKIFIREKKGSQPAEFKEGAWEVIPDLPHVQFGDRDLVEDLSDHRGRNLPHDPNHSTS